MLTSPALTDNGASCRVLEKCWFRRNGTVSCAFPGRGGMRPVHTYRQDRAAWLARAGAAFGQRISEDST